MTFRVVCVVLGLTILPLTGCGTTANLMRLYPEQNGKIPFGGVKQDMWCLAMAANGESNCCPGPVAGCNEVSPRAAMFWCAVDLPFSCIGDLLTCPYVMGYRFINQPIPIPPVPQVQLFPVAKPQPYPIKATNPSYSNTKQPDTKQPDTKQPDTNTPPVQQPTLPPAMELPLPGGGQPPYLP